MKFSFTALLEKLTNPYPMRDWYIAFFIALVAFGVLIGIALYLFIGIQSGAIIVPQEAAQKPPLNVSRESLTDTLEVYEERALNFETSNYPIPNIPDPAR